MFLKKTIFSCIKILNPERVRIQVSGSHKPEEREREASEE